MLHDDPEFNSLLLNSVALSRVPDEVITIDDLEEGEWTDNEVVEDKACTVSTRLKSSLQNSVANQFRQASFPPIFGKMSATPASCPTLRQTLMFW